MFPFCMSSPTPLSPSINTFVVAREVTLLHLVQGVMLLFCLLYPLMLIKMSVSTQYLTYSPIMPFFFGQYHFSPFLSFHHIYMAIS